MKAGSRPSALRNRHLRSDLLLLLALAAAVFLAGLAVPYRLDSDTGFQLRSVQQWALGLSPSPGTLRLPDPHDLSRDRLLWSNWWPPGFPFLCAPLVAAGLSIADALRLLSFVLFLAGSSGWLLLLRELELPPVVHLLFTVALASYAMTIGGAASMRSADVLAYAAGSWLALLALRLEEAPPRPQALFLGGVLLGASYWLRYSLFLAAVALLAWLAVRTACRHGRPDGRALGSLVSLGAGFALPVLGLTLLNLAVSGNLSESLTGTRSAWALSETRSARPLALAVSLAGAPGLALFQNDLWLNHLTHFSDSWVPMFRALDPAQRIVAKALLGIPATAVLAWGLARGRRRRPGAPAILAVALPAGFYLLLAVLSLAVRYNYLAKEARFASCFLPLVFPFVLAGWLERDLPDEDRWTARQLAGLGLTALFFAVPLLFVTANFVRNEIGDRLAVRYRPSATGLYMPELSSRDVPEVRETVAAMLQSPRDLVVVAGPSGWGSAFLLWLEFPQRVFPVGTFVAPLGAGYLDASDLRSTAPLRSSRRLRVVLVADRGLAEDGSLLRLQSRFPQARSWRSAPLPAHAHTVVSYSDLEVD